MPPPPAADPVALVDAVALAHAGSSVGRRFTIAELPRLREAGARNASVAAHLDFVEFDGQPAIRGALEGSIELQCQRCLESVTAALDERFQVLLVGVEREDEPGGYEPVIADAARLDVRWLVEEQALLAIPLVPMHTAGACEKRGVAKADEEQVEDARQKPFANLRDMLRER